MRSRPVRDAELERRRRRVDAVDTGRAGLCGRRPIFEPRCSLCNVAGDEESLRGEGDAGDAGDLGNVGERGDNAKGCWRKALSAVGAREETVEEYDCEKELCERCERAELAYFAGRDGSGSEGAGRGATPREEREAERRRGRETGASREALLLLPPLLAGTERRGTAGEAKGWPDMLLPAGAWCEGTGATLGRCESPGDS